jgi:amphiphysin
VFRPRLNVFYLMLEKIQTFVDGKYDLQRNDLDQIYDEAVGDIPERLESLQIVQRQVSTGMFSSLSRAAAPPSPSQ